MLLVFECGKVFQLVLDDFVDLKPMIADVACFWDEEELQYGLDAAEEDHEVVSGHGSVIIRRCCEQTTYIHSHPSCVAIGPETTAVKFEMPARMKLITAV